MPATPTIKGLGAVQPHVKAAAEEIAATFGVYNIGGFASSGHITNSDHYRGLAIDVMSAEKGPLISEWALANAARLSVKYVIWNRRYNGLDGKGWVQYTGSSPHTDHVHISFKTTVDAAGGAATGDSDPNAELAGCIGKLLGMKIGG